MPKRLPSLDGLRAVSILAVLLGHLDGTRGFPLHVANPYVDLAHLGVRVFFVISGFLITGLLVSEERQTGTVSLRDFYLRRAFRIVPPYAALLLVVALTASVPASDWWHAVTWTMNYATHRTWTFGHLWSLSVEEQFYLLWPAAFLLAGRRRAWVAVAVIAVAPIVRLVEAYTPLAPMVGNTFETTADALAMGCLLALWRPDWTPRRWLAPALLVAGLVLSLRVRPGYLIGETLVNAGLAVGIARAVRRPGWLLNTRPLVQVGLLSYSLYLWQQVFLNRASNAWWTAFPTNVGLALACAVASYWLVEQPALRARRRWSHHDHTTSSSVTVEVPPKPLSLE